MTRPATPKKRVVVRELLEESARHLRLRLVSGALGLDRFIDRSRIQRPGLALTGFTRYLSYGRVQIVGGSESAYLKTLRSNARREILRRMLKEKLSCLIMTRGLSPFAELKEETERAKIPLLSTPLDSTPFIKGLSEFLDARLAPSLRIHAVMVDVFGVGVLIQGESGIGKSECALELIDRGHRLVADDVVDLKATSLGLVGESPSRTRDLMEIRGLGLLDIKTLYGVSAVRPLERVDLVVRLERWKERRSYDRLGIDAETVNLVGQKVPLLRLPVAPGRNVALLVEIAAKNHRLKLRGHNVANDLVRRLDGEWTKVDEERTK